jgi:RND family efflux transporter MFP subunit
MKRRNVIVAIIVIVVVVAAILISRNRSAATSTYVTENVIRQDINFTVSANGFVNPANTYNINPRISAKVIEINVSEGDTVTKDQQLAKLDDTDLQNAVKTAQYNFNSAVYTRNQLQNMPVVDDLSVKKAQQQVNVASVQLQSAKNNLNNAIIRSPSDGIVFAVNIKLNDYTAPTAVQPAFTVGSTGPLESYLQVNELDVNKVKLGQDVSLGIDAVGGTLSGKVLSIDAQGTNLAGIIYFQITTSITEQTGLKPNMSVNGDVIIQSSKNVLTVPAGALIQKNGKTFVELASYDNNNKLITTEKEVQIGINNNTLAEVTSGLSEGDLVIINFTNTTTQTTGFSFGGGQ